MNNTEVVKRIITTVDNLNNMNNKVTFTFTEDMDGVYIECHSKTQEGTRFGRYECMALFNEFTEKIYAYIACMKFVEVITAALKLNDPKAYHNIIG